MKKTIIAAIVGTLIMFVYSALAWMVLPIHNDSMKYTPEQDSIIATVSANLKEDGVYMLPGCEPGTSHEEQEKQMKEMEGKPWMMIQYHSSFQGGMTGSMIMGFIINFLAVLIAVMVINATRNNYGSFSTRFMITLSFGLIIVISNLATWNWMGTPFHYIKGEIIDAILSWGLCGLWLGKYLKAPTAAE